MISILFVLKEANWLLVSRSVSGSLPIAIVCLVVFLDQPAWTWSKDQVLLLLLGGGGQLE